MPWSGSGQFNRNNGVHSGSTTWAQDAAEPANILSARHDSHDEDLAAGLENCVTLDGQTTPTANLPMGTFRHTNVGAASARTDYARTSQVQDSAFLWGTVGGTANAITLTVSPAITAYTAGLKVRFLAALDNTGSATVNINSVGVNTIKKIAAEGGAAVTNLVAADILDNGIFELVYDGTNFILLNPATTTWTSWTPTLSAGGSMTYTSTTVTRAKYFRQGSKVWFSIEITGTTGGTPHTDLLFTLPITCASTAFGGGAKLSNVGTRTGGIWSTNSTTQVTVSKYDVSNWGAGANTGYTINGLLESA